MPPRIRRYLNARGVADSVIHRFLLGWNGRRITIPISDRAGKLALFRLARDPSDHLAAPKMLTPNGSSVELYGWERLRKLPKQIIVCEGEFDRLVLESRGFAAVTSTGGAGVFRSAWAEILKRIPKVYICFDRDEAGREGALRVAQTLTHANLVELPREVGPGGDITDFFVRLGRDRGDFLRVLATARPMQRVKLTPTICTDAPPRGAAGGELGRLKSMVALETVVHAYMPLRSRGKTCVAKCPFHDDRTPSFVIYLDSQHFHCFGCQAHGDVIAFLMQIEMISFQQAVTALRDLAS